MHPCFGALCAWDKVNNLFIEKQCREWRRQRPYWAMTGLLKDVRFALRQLRKNPGFTQTATAMLALAICANSTVFSWIDGTMLRPIPGARDAASMVSLMRGQWNISP